MFKLRADQKNVLSFHLFFYNGSVRSTGNVDTVVPAHQVATVPTTSVLRRNGVGSVSSVPPRFAARRTVYIVISSFSCVEVVPG